MNTQATEQQPGPCEYCSIWNDTMQEHDGTCDNLTSEQLQAKISGARQVIPAQAVEAARRPSSLAVGRGTHGRS